MGLLYVGYLSIWDSSPWYGETYFARHSAVQFAVSLKPQYFAMHFAVSHKPWLCGTPGYRYVGQFG